MSPGAFQVLPLAAGIQLIHDFSLIHDDIEDNSDTRRGRPTVWKLWGLAQGINAGDRMFVVAHLALHRLGDGAVPIGAVVAALEHQAPHRVEQPAPHVGVTARAQNNPDAPAPSATKLERITQYFDNEVATGKLAGAVVLVQQHGRPVYLKSFGVRDVATRHSMTPDTIFAIHSMTKPITSVAAMMLIDAGKLALQDPVSKFIPSFADVKVAVKTERLSDCVPLLDLGAQAGRQAGFVAIGMGPFGLVTRVLAGRFGSMWTYAGSNHEIGQVSAATLLNEYRFRSLTDATVTPATPRAATIASAAPRKSSWLNFG